MKKKIIHLSHTDIKCDPRIIKELYALSLSSSYQIYAMGVQAEKGSYEDIAPESIRPLGFNIFLTKKINFKIKFFQSILNFIKYNIGFFIKSIKLSPDIVHCHDFMILFSGMLIKFFTGCTLIYDAHELGSDKNGTGFFISKIVILIEKICWNKIDLLISVSDGILNWYLERFGQKDSLTIMNSPEKCMSFEFFQKNYFRKIYNIENKKIIFIYIGSLVEGRGIRMFLDVFSEKERDAHIVFLGFGPLEPLVESFSKRYLNIHLHPPVLPEQVTALAQHADIGLCMIENVSLSDFYCLPNKFFEYIFAGLPVLASDFPDLRRIINQYNLGVCCSPDLEGFRSAVSNIICNGLPKPKSDLSPLGWPAQAAKLIRAYDDLLKEKGCEKS